MLNYILKVIAQYLVDSVNPEFEILSNTEYQNSNDKNCEAFFGKASLKSKNQAWLLLPWADCRMHLYIKIKH